MLSGPSIIDALCMGHEEFMRWGQLPAGQWHAGASSSPLMGARGCISRNFTIWLSHSRYLKYI